MTKPTDPIKLAATNAAAGVEAGLAIAAAQIPAVQEINGRQVFFRQNAQGVFEAVELSTLAPAPQHLEQTTLLATPRSFIDYLKLFGSKAQTIIFATEAQAKLSAAISFHVMNAPSWNKHHAHLCLELTQGWKDWNKNNKVEMDQSTFAQFIEDRIPDIADPSGATLVELARNFEDSRDVVFKSVKRAHDGTMSLNYTETSVDGAFKMPREFTLALLPFEGSAGYLPKGIKAYAVTARIRYRIASGKLTIWYELVRPQDVFKEAFANVVEAVRVETVEVSRGVLFGSS